MSTSHKQLYFYSPEGLALVKHADVGVSALLRAAGQTLAQRDDGQAVFYAVDGQGSVLRFSTCSLEYTAYGHDRDKQCASVLRYSGQRKEAVTGHYLLGNGYRAFSSALMRFNAPDNLSPFAQGGLNAYSYCGGDPVNRTDPSGHMMKSLFRSRSRRTPVSSSPSLRLGSPVASTEQTNFNNRMNERLTTHNEAVHANTFEVRLASQGRQTGAWIDEFTKRTEFTQNDKTLLTGATVSALRDAERTASDLLQNPPSTPRDIRVVSYGQQMVLFKDVEKVLLKTSASLVPSVDSWLHGKNVSSLRKAG